MDPAKQELRDLIRSKLTEGMTPDDAADALLDLFHWVEDDWVEIGVSTVGDVPGSRVLAERFLVARVPRESRHQNRDLSPNRTVTSAPA